MKERSNASNFQENIFENVTSHEQLDPKMVRGIIKCVSSSGMRTTDEDVLNHISGDVVHVLTDGQTGEVVAFSSTLYRNAKDVLHMDGAPDAECCYLQGATVSQDWQGEGVYKKLNESRIKIGVNKGLSLVCTQTQNPRVQSGIQTVLAEMQENGVIAGYTLQRVLKPGCYGRMLTAEKPTDNKVSFDELDYDKGDAYILLFSLQYKQE